jgi:hypothetical protein
VGLGVLLSTLCCALFGVLQGVPPDMRRQVWLALSGAAHRRQKLPPHYYADAALQGASSQFAHQIDLVSLRHGASACLLLLLA